MDKFSKEKRSEIMSKIRGKDTRMEVAFRKTLWGLGLRGFRKHHGKRKIDVAFPKRKVAIFLDSCFWHGCPRHYKEPKTRREYWISKIEENRRRDKKTTRALRKKGWKVIRIWEHSLKTPVMRGKQAKKVRGLL